MVISFSLIHEIIVKTHYNHRAAEFEYIYLTNEGTKTVQFKNGVKLSLLHFQAKILTYRE